MPEAATLTERQCAWHKCKNSFVLTQPDKRFCSPKCRHRDWMSRHADKNREWARRWYKANRNRKREKSAVWMKANPDKVQDARRRWKEKKRRGEATRDKYLEQHRQYMKHWREENREKYLEQKREANNRRRSMLRRLRRLEHAAVRVNKVLLVVPIMKETADE